MTYFNEIDNFAAQWLRNLFPDATIDARSIKDVTPDDVRRFERCHFFGGIGGWELALQLAGWVGPVWTGSCPCQPFSCAGKGKGEEDPRHLWPDFFRLIRECRPATIFGEQVASKDGLRWLDGVFADLEGADYACGAADLCAASIQAPHIRQRLFWVAYADDGRQRAERDSGSVPAVCERTAMERCETEESGLHGRLADGTSGGRGERGDAAQSRSIGHIDGGCELDWLGIPIVKRLEGHAGHVGHGDEPGRIDASKGRSVAASGAWSDFIAIPCSDGRRRRISAKPGDEPLAYGIPIKAGSLVARLVGMGHSAKAAKRIVKLARSNRVGRLRGYGNAIVPELAALFIRAFKESTHAAPH